MTFNTTENISEIPLWLKIAVTLSVVVASITCSLAQDLQFQEAPDFRFYFLRGYVFSPAVEEQGIYSYVREGNSINLLRFDFLAGKELSNPLCNKLAEGFNKLKVRTMIKASEAKGLEFKVEGGVRSCYYRYDLRPGDKMLIAEYKVYQRLGLQAYIITDVYTAHSPDQAALHKALHSFVIKKSATLTSQEPNLSTSSEKVTSAPSSYLESNSSFVLVDQREPAFIVFIGVPKGTDKTKLEDFMSKNSNGESVNLLTWKQFIERVDKYATSTVLRNDYPKLPVIEGIVCLVGTQPGGPWGLTWNGGIALTRTHYNKARQRYESYKSDPNTYKPIRDPRADPVNPRNKLTYFGCI